MDRLREQLRGIDAEREVFESEGVALAGEIAEAVETGGDRSGLYERQRVIVARYEQANAEVTYLSAEIGVIEGRQAEREQQRRHEAAVKPHQEAEAVLAS